MISQILLLFFFSILGEVLSADIPSAICNDNRAYLTHNQNNEVIFAFSTILNEQMMTLISNLNQTGPGQDGIKENGEYLSLLITHICNKSLPEGKFSSNLYKASFSCIYKTGAKKSRKI